MVVLDERLVLVEGILLAVGVGEEGKILSTVVEIFLRQHTVVDEDLQVVPLFFELFAVVLEDGLQTVGHLLGDVRRNLLDVGVALQVRTRYVQRDVGRIKHAVEQRQEVGHDAFYRIRNVYLVAVKLYLVLVQLDVALHFGEVEHASEVERIVHVQVNPE